MFYQSVCCFRNTINNDATKDNKTSTINNFADRKRPVRSAEPPHSAGPPTNRLSIVSIMVDKENWAVVAIRKHIGPNKSLPGTGIAIRIDKSPVCWIIITRLQVVESRLITDSNLNHTGIYLYSKGKIMIHLTFDYKTDEKCTTPGQYLKYHRTFQGLTTRELAEKVGIVPATLVLYENDRHPIKHDIAVALANTLGIDRNRLLDEYTTFVDYPYSSLLKKVRHELSLTQMQMAEVIGIGQTTYSGWEREARVPRRKEHDKILAALKKLKVNVDTYLCQSTSI